MPQNNVHKDHRSRLRAYLALVLMSLLYSGNLISARVLAPQVPPIALSALRGVLGLMVLVPLAWRPLKTSPKLTKRDLASMALLGFLGITLAYASFLWGMRYSTASNAAIIFATSPAMTNVLLAVGWRVKPARSQVMGIVVAFLGLAIVISQGSLGQLLAFHLSLSDLALLGNVMAVALFTIFGQSVMTRFAPIVTTVYSLFFGTLFLLPYGLWEIAQQGWHPSWGGWLIFLYMGFIVTGFALFLNFAAIEVIGSGQSAVFGNLSPVFSMVLAVFLLGEHLYTYHLVGFVLVLSGIFLSVFHDLRKTPKPPATMHAPVGCLERGE